jgi:hypothetical protein
MASVVEDYLARTDAAGWNVFTSVNWGAADASRLTEDQRLAVVFITHVEDHLPGYFTEYDRLFPVDDQVDRETYLSNRELYRFTVRWAQEEERHAHALSLYQVRSGLTDADTLRHRPSTRAANGIGSHTPSRSRSRCTRSCRKSDLSLLPCARERHRRTGVACHSGAARAGRGATFRVLLASDRRLRAHVRGTRRGSDARGSWRFKMPLADTLNNYWRIALRISDAAGGYDYTQAFDDLVHVVQRAAGADAWSKQNSLVSFVDAVRGRTGT